MSIKSQTNNMRRLAALLNFNLCNIRGKKECGPNGSKQVFLNVGKVFLRALARDLGLHDVTVSSNAGGIGVSGDCNLIGMWENGGLYVSISQPACGSGNTVTLAQPGVGHMIYRMSDVSTAAYHACRSQNRTEEEKERLFYKALAGKALQTIPWEEKSKDNENT